LLHLVGCLYYLYQWCTVKQISDNEIYLLITLNRRTSVALVIWRALKFIFLNVAITANCKKTAKQEGIIHTGQYGSYICKPTATIAIGSTYIHCNKPVLLSESVRGLPVTFWKSACKEMQLGVHHLIKFCEILHWNALFYEHNVEKFRHEIERKR
jgi:hypothetical protein